MDHGKKLLIPARDFRACFIFGIIGIVSISRCGLWRCTVISVLVGRCGQTNFDITFKELTFTGPSIDARRFFFLASIGSRAA